MSDLLALPDLVTWDITERLGSWSGQEMNDVVPGFPFNLFKPPLCMTLAKIPMERVVKKLDTLSRSGSLTPLGEKGPRGFDNDYDLCEPFNDTPNSIGSLPELQILLEHESQNPDCFDYDAAAVTKILSCKREIRLDFDVWPAEKGTIVARIRNMKIVRAIGRVKELAERLNSLGKTHYFVEIVHAHHGQGQTRETPGLPYCIFLFDKEKGTDEHRMYRCTIRNQFDGPKFAVMDKDIERIVLGDIAMPNGMKEKPIIPLLSEKIEEEYLKLWSRVQPKKESRNPKPEGGSKKRKQIAKPECASRKRKRAAKDCFDGSKLSRNSGVLDFLRHEAATDFDNVAKSVSEDLKHEGNVVEEDTDDEEESYLDWDSPSNEEY